MGMTGVVDAINRKCLLVQTKALYGDTESKDCNPGLRASDLLPECVDYTAIHKYFSGMLSDCKH